MAISDNQEEVREVWMPGSDKLLIVFSGFGGRLFNYMSITSKYDYNRIFLRDPRKVWYHWGIEGQTRNIEGTAEYLIERIAERGIRKVATLGNSGGGYAALVFGWLLSADVVHAFSAQTMLEEDHPRLQVLRKDADVCPQYFDVKPLLADPNGRTKYHIYYSFTAERDKAHAERLEGLPDTYLHGYEKGGHALSQILTRDGTLDKILASIFDEEAA